MDDGNSLVSAEASKSYRVIKIIGRYGMIRKLNLLGVKEGKTIKKISSQPMRGPVVIEVGGSQVAIGYRMAARVMIEVIA
jgi:ferrous iron transport protein A